MSDLKNQISAIVQSCQPKRRIVHGSARDVPRVAWDPKFPKQDQGQEPKRSKAKVQPQVDPVIPESERISYQEFFKLINSLGMEVNEKGVKVYRSDSLERRKIDVTNDSVEAIRSFTGRFNPKIDLGIQMDAARREAYRRQHLDMGTLTVEDTSRPRGEGFVHGNAAYVTKAKAMAQLGAARRAVNEAIRTNNVDEAPKLIHERDRLEKLVDDLIRR